jgi:probable addiction module antidote protein
MSKAPRKTGIDPGKVAAPYDAADYLRTPEGIVAYLEAIFEDYGDDARVVAKALGDVARATGMQKVAKETGLNREGLYQALSGAGNPSFDTVLKVMRSVGVELRPKAVTRQAAPRFGGKTLSASEILKKARAKKAARRVKAEAPARKRA